MKTETVEMEVSQLLTRAWGNGSDSATDLQRTFTGRVPDGIIGSGARAQSPHEQDQMEERLRMLMGSELKTMMSRCSPDILVPANARYTPVHRGPARAAGT